MKYQVTIYLEVEDYGDGPHEAAAEAWDILQELHDSDDGVTMLLRDENGEIHERHVRSLREDENIPE